MEVVVAKTWDGLPLATPAATLWIDRGGPAWRIRVEAPFHDDPAPEGPPGPTDRLWDHEVVELFVVGEDERYTEIELGPHGHHLVLQLEGVRRPVRTLIPIAYSAVILGDRWHGEAVIPRELLPPALSYNAYAIHGVGDERRYLAAVPVPGPGPDFHRLGSFAEWPLGG